ncbi:serine--tRNA ligase [Paenibacillus sp. FSL W8-1187]|uniref:Serine--tRNA ligase n=1 Tax=Paenibacillus pasadenensis TaxID=217090 RepID=A0A2N5N177_9BACL|nr:serine--tRNA ligase [Paenibacillus pasadenensis]PLT44094.1 Seryl-tRNA synthetase [Paenibacillus pasadenensis]
MLDLAWIREHEEEVREAARRKGMAFQVEELLDADRRRRALVADVEERRRARNMRSEGVARCMREGRKEEAAALQEAGRREGAELAALEPRLAAAEAALRKLLLETPNLVSPDTPHGASEAENIELARRGAPPEFGFEPLDHVELAERHGLADFARGAKTAGSRSYYLTGMGALLHRAVQQLAVDRLLAAGFELLEVPVMLRGGAFEQTGFFPAGEDQVYALAGEDLRLAGTAEVPLVAYYAGEVLELDRPIRLAAASACFRSEAGSAGRDTRGLYRVHQFAKVEQVVLCRADLGEAEALLQEITGHAASLLEALELPHRVMAVCAGDMSAKTYKQYDLETWMPGRKAYGETHSSSLLLDYQARRAGIRYREADGSLKHAYTLNNTAVASPRILVPLLENHQQEDGSIAIPAALRPYLGGRAKLEAPARS